MFFIFSKFWFSGLLGGGGGGGKRAKNEPKWQEIQPVVLHISRAMHHMHQNLFQLTLKLFFVSAKDCEFKYLHSNFVFSMSDSTVYCIDYTIFNADPSILLSARDKRLPQHSTKTRYYQLFETNIFQPKIFNCAKYLSAQ